MNLRAVRIVYRKELRDLLRDKRTIISMVLWPLLFFPLMSAGTSTVQQRFAKKAESESVRIELIGAENAPEFADRLAHAKGIDVLPPDADYINLISHKQLQAAVEIPAGFETGIKTGNEPPQIKIDYYRSEIRSENAADRVEDAVKSYRDDVASQRLKSHGVLPVLLNPVQVDSQNVAAPERVAGNKLGTILPYFIIFLCYIGGLSAATDIAAGEKERGTMETILASSVERSDLAFGKFLTVLTAMLVSTSLSMFSFSMTLRFAKDYAQQMSGGHSFVLSPATIGLILLIVFPLAVLFSATLLVVSVSAKSFKEAQSNAGFLIFLVIVPAILGMIPGIDLSPKLALIPILNVSLVARELFTGSFPWANFGIAFVAMCVYGGIMLALAIKLFQREDVIFRT